MARLHGVGALGVRAVLLIVFLVVAASLLQRRWLFHLKATPTSFQEPIAVESGTKGRLSSLQRNESSSNRTTTQAVDLNHYSAHNMTEQVSKSQQLGRLPKPLNVPKQIARNQSVAEQLSRVFPVWNRSTTPYSWCHTQEETNSGILFVKLNKCASSTGMGVSLRIADTLGRRLLGNNNNSHCVIRYRHGWAGTGDRQYLSRKADRSVLWSMLRHPAPRVLSDYFFYQASRRSKNVTEESILKYIRDDRFKKHYVDYLRLKQFMTREEEIGHLVQNYDFLAVSERMGESLVVLSMILKVPLADVIVLPSKQAGGYDDGRSRRGCVKLKQKWTTSKIDEYLEGGFLKDNFDYLLYQAANTSLDRTIDALGRNEVAAGVKLYRELLQKNDRVCRQQAIFPCPISAPNHTYLSQQDCYFSDAGCGHKCTDGALRTESKDEWNRFQPQQ